MTKIWSLKLSHEHLKEILALFGDLSKERRLVSSVSDYLRAVFKEGEELQPLSFFKKENHDSADQ